MNQSQEKYNRKESAIRKNIIMMLPSVRQLTTNAGRRNEVWVRYPDSHGVAKSTRG